MYVPGCFVDTRFGVVLMLVRPETESSLVGVGPVAGRSVNL